MNLTLKVKTIKIETSYSKIIIFKSEEEMDNNNL